MFDRIKGILDKEGIDSDTVLMKIAYFRSYADVDSYGFYGGRNMQILTLYLTTSVVFLALDIVMLKRVLYPLFSSNLGDWLLEDPRMGPAAIFYLFYVAAYFG